MARHKIGGSDTSGRFNVGLHKTMDGGKRQPNGCLAEGKKESSQEQPSIFTASMGEIRTTKGDPSGGIRMGLST